MFSFSSCVKPSPEVEKMCNNNPQLVQYKFISNSHVIVLSIPPLQILQVSENKKINIEGTKLVHNLNKLF